MVGGGQLRIGLKRGVEIRDGAVEIALHAPGDAAIVIHLRVLRISRSAWLKSAMARS
jgi:hypothetical protein